MSNDYQMTQQIGRNVTDTMLLPCVEGCHKAEDGKLVYHVTAENSEYAVEGDLLCLKRNGLWFVEKGGAV